MEQATLICAGGCAISRTARTPRVLALVGGRARAVGPVGTAQRGAASPRSAGAGVRCGRRRVVGAAASRGRAGLSGSRAHPAGRRPGGGRQAGRAAIDALPRWRMAARGAAAAKVAVALPRSQVLRKTIVLPAAVEENLGQALAWDLDRHTPFKPEEVYFDAVVIGRDPRRRKSASTGRRRCRRSWIRRGGGRKAGARLSSA